MAGRRRTGAAASAVDLATKLIFANMQAQQERQQRAAELYQKFQLDMLLEQVKSGKLALDPATGRLIPGQGAKAPAGLEPSEFTDQSTGVKYSRPNVPKDPSFMPQSQTEEILGTARPEHPLPATRTDEYGRTISNIPVSTEGVNTMNRAISGGMTQSPASTYLGVRPTAASVPNAQFLRGPGGFISGENTEVLPGYESFLEPRESVLDLVRSGEAQPQLPDPAGVREGTVIEDDQTGQRFKLIRGQWQPA